MRCVTGKQHSASAVGIDKPRVVRPSAPAFKRFHMDVHAGNAA